VTTATDFPSAPELRNSVSSSRCTWRPTNADPCVCIEATGKTEVVAFCAAAACMKMLRFSTQTTKTKQVSRCSEN